MVDSIKQKLFRYFFKDQIALLAMKETLLLAKQEAFKKESNEFNNKVNQRVAEVTSKMDPLEPLMRKHFVLFSKEYERPEDQLEEQSKITMYMWGNNQQRDPHFHRMINWIIDNYGNQLLKKSNPTPENLLYNRAQMGAAILMKAEVKRLSNLYQKIITNKDDEADEGLTVED